MQNDGDGVLNSIAITNWVKCREIMTDFQTCTQLEPFYARIFNFIAIQLRTMYAGLDTSILKVQLFSSLTKFCTKIFWKFTTILLLLNFKIFLCSLDMQRCYRSSVLTGPDEDIPGVLINTQIWRMKTLKNLDSLFEYCNRIFQHLYSCQRIKLITNIFSTNVDSHIKHI